MDSGNTDPDGPVETAPKSITLYDREGNFAFRLDPNSFHFGPVTSTCDILDLRTGERRSSTKKDLEECAILLDALDNISWNSDICTLNDVDQTYADVEEVCTLLQNTRKPFWYFASSMENLEAPVRKCSRLSPGARRHCGFVPLPSILFVPWTPCAIQTTASAS